MRPSTNIPYNCSGITIYPWDYFCPIEFLSHKLEITENTYTIHHYSATWMSWLDKLKMKKGYYATKNKTIIKVKQKLIMNQTKVSIIVPVYNVEKYLDRCLTSLINQTLKDIEIILVDDESPDNCPAICDNYCPKMTLE